MDVSATFDEYLNKSDWRVKENSNTAYCYGTLNKHVIGKASALYWEEIYNEVDPDIMAGHRKAEYHVHDLGAYSSYCLGASLRDLLTDGVKGVTNISVSGPAKRLRAACAHISNAVQIIQNEIAGAVAFSSVNVYLAPFIYFDALRRRGIRDYGIKVDIEYNDRDLDDVYQSIESMIYQLNSNTRMGCVDEDTEILTPSGFKKYDQLKEGDEVYTWAGGRLNINAVEKVNVYDYDGEMHEYTGKDYIQYVTPNHRILKVNYHNKEAYDIIKSEELFDHKTPGSFPIAALDNTDPDLGISDDDIIMSAFFLTEGSIHRNTIRVYKSPNRWGNDELVELLNRRGYDYRIEEIERPVSHQEAYGSYKMLVYHITAPDILSITNWKKSIPELFLKFSKRQAKLFLETWYRLDGSFKVSTDGTRHITRKLQCDTKEIADQIQIIAARACLGSWQHEYDWNGRNSQPTIYVNLYEGQHKSVTQKRRVRYCGKVWCPTTSDGIVIFRKEGRTFVSGNSEPSFSNVTLDFSVLGPMKTQPVIVGGKQHQAYTYADFQKEADIFANVFAKILIKGDYSGKPFAYPIPTFNISKDMDWDSHPQVWELAAKNGSPYFGNFINSPMSEDDVYSMCCRLRLDKSELVRKTGGLFGAAERTGSVGVFTINLPSIAYLAKGDAEVFYAELSRRMDLGYKQLEKKREVINYEFDRGLYPALTQYLKRTSTLFSTIGFVGGHEMCLNMLGKGIETPEGREFMVEVVNRMLAKLVGYQEESGNLYNLEYTPAESAAFRMAMRDKQRYPDIITAGTAGRPYYTNSTHLPVGINWSHAQVFKHQHGLLSLATGGSVWHSFIAEPTTAELVKKYVKTTFENYDIPYLSISPVYSICDEDGFLPGYHDECPQCGGKATAYQRVTGYCRPINNFNDGKYQEFRERNQRSL